MTPNTDQITSAVRWVISTFGGMLAGWFAAKGWFTVDQVMQVLNLPVVTSVIVSIVGLIWGVSSHTDKAKVAAVTAMARDPASPVQAVVVAPTPAGRELVQAVTTASPNPGVVLAGTPAAATAAGARI